MKTLVILSLLALVLTTYVSMQAVTSISSQSTCISCHSLKHQENSLYLDHSNKSINCIDCHSGQGIRGYVESRNEMVDAILVEKSRQVLSYFYQNTSSSFIHLQANCTKCHLRVKSEFYNHSKATNCIQCHRIDIMTQNPETGFWKKMGTGGHRNKTCEDCHSTNFRIIACTTCHTPHKEGANWNNSACLACHSSPHIPVRSGTLSESAAKEDCAVCHASPYGTLTFYNSRHNQLGSCVKCHPAHGAVKDCIDCHSGEHISHPFARENCAGCHGKAGCQDCHKEPHAPLIGLPKISTKEQFNDYASTRKSH